MKGLFGRSKKSSSRKRAKKRVKKTKKVMKRTKKKVKRVRRVKPVVKKKAKRMKKPKPKAKRMKKIAKRTRKPKVVKPSFKKMPDEKAFEILKRYRIKTPSYDFCKNEKELEKALKKVGLPCVMKVSGDIIHKTEVNGVRKNISEKEDAVKAFNELMKIKGCDKVLVQEPVNEGYEIIVGGKKDPQFNRVVALGAGGIFTEFLKDVSFRIVPLSRTDAEEMLKEVKFSELLLKGFRGQKPADKESIVDAILAVSKIMEKYPKIKELDINPLFATPSNAIAADVRVILE